MSMSITEIARRANLSANTVSRALRNLPGVNRETAFRVHKLAKELGYTPNRFAQGLVSKESRLIALAITEPESYYQSVIQQELRRKLLGAGYHSLIMEIDYEDGEQQFNIISELAGLQADAIVVGSMYGIISESPVWESLRFLKTKGIPTVVYGLGRSRKVNLIHIDYEMLAYNMVKHLFDYGYRDILIFDTAVHSERAIGYSRAAQDFGIEPKIVETGGKAGMELGYRCINEYLDGGKPLPEVIMARNDMQAIGVMSALRDRGIRVPGDVAVTGFDNIEVAEYYAPRLTSAWISPLQTAEAIFQMLMRQIKLKGHESEPEQVTLRGEIVIRESSGNPERNINRQ